MNVRSGHFRDVWVQCFGNPLAQGQNQGGQNQGGQNQGGQNQGRYEETRTIRSAKILVFPSNSISQIYFSFYF